MRSRGSRVIPRAPAFVLPTAVLTGKLDRESQTQLRRHTGSP